MESEPIIGQWYRDIQHRLFEVVALDDDAIEIQYFDGDVEELDMESWHQLVVASVAEPNDGSGPFDDLDEDEINSLEGDYRPAGW